MFASILLLPVVVPVVFDSSYSPMVSGAQIMMVGTTVSTVFFWLQAYYYASGKIGIWAKAYGLYTVLIIGLAWLCVQWWGFMGMASLVAAGKVLFTLSMSVAFAVH